jgi:gliding motility-associated-like protein
MRLIKFITNNTKAAVLLAFFAGLVNINEVFSQNVEIIPGNDTTLCTNQTLPLTVSVDPASNLGGSSAFVGYDFLEIPIAAGPTTGTNITLTDDVSSGAINIGFPFQFFGSNYNQLYVSANGWVGFNAPLTGDYTPEAFPTCNGPNSAIMACWQDFNPGTGGTVRYSTTGTAPNRRFIVSWNAIPFFGSTCTGVTSSFQIMLYETTNVIEIHIVNKPACPALWSTGAVTGIVGANSAPACNCYNIESAFNNYTGAIVNRAFRYTPIIGNLNGVNAVLQTLQWSVNGSNVGSSNSPNYTAFMTSTTATRTVVVTATFSIPCVGNVVVRDTVVITPRPYDPAFTATSPICAGQEASIVTYTGSSTPTAAATVAWDFGGGTAVPGTGLGPHSVTWSTPGNKVVSLSISGGACAAASHDTIVEVVPSPTSTFTTTSQVCGAAAATITYTGNAPSSATYTWSFDGGVAVPANGQGPFSVTWATPGVKTVRLTVSIGSCVSSETTHQVTVLPPPSGTFSISQATVCEGSPISLTYTGTAPSTATYTWNLDGGTGTPTTGQGPISVSWASAGNKTVTLQVNDNGCISNLASSNVLVNPIPTAAFTTTAGVCPNANATVTYTGTATASASFNWSWDSGTAASGTGIGPHTVNWASPGLKTLSLTVTQNGCVSTPVNQPVTVYQIPTSAFTATPTGVCVGQTTSLSYTGTASAGATYNWNFVSGTALPGGTTQGPQSVSWSNSGMKNLTLTVTENGCVSPVTTVPVDVFLTPTADFSVTPAVCPGVDATVTYSGTGTASATYSWNFNGGIANPTNTTSAGPYAVNWATSGNKTISLIVTENGCSSPTFTQSVNVYTIPNSSFTAISPVCAGTSTAVTYTGGAANSSNFVWNFPGGVPSNPAGVGPHDIVFNTPGTYLLNLAVTENGCVSPSTQVQVVVNPIPTTTFTASAPVCLDGSTTLQYTGNAPTSANYNWDFDGGNANINIGPGPLEVNWTTPGAKTITLSVNSLGCNSASPHQEIVQVLTLPEVDAGLDKELCSGALTEIGNVNGNSSYTYSWLPETGLAAPDQSSTSVQLMNNTNSTQTFIYVLTADDGQCIARDSMQYSVTAPPFVSFASPQGQCFNGNSFNFLAEGAFTSTAQFIWGFGPNASVSSSSVINPANISFDTTGSQTVTLQVNDGGCFSNLYTAGVVIFPEPLADFYTEVVDGCAPLEVKFINTSAGPSTMQYSWNFGFGQPSTSPQPSFNYEVPGVYDVSLNITTQQGCSNSIDRKDYITIYAKPKASFNLSAEVTNILEPEITFGAAVNNATDIWYSISPLDTTLFGTYQTFAFPDTGKYEIEQFVSNEFGCSDSTVRSLRINTGYKVYIPNSFSPNNDGINDIFRPYGESIIDYSIVVYNRWGQQIYSSRDIENGWDGTAFLSNNAVPQGVYLYKMTISDELGYSHKYEGIVNVVR